LAGPDIPADVFGLLDNIQGDQFLDLRLFFLFLAILFRFLISVFVFTSRLFSKERTEPSDQTHAITRLRLGCSFIALAGLAQIYRDYLILDGPPFGIIVFLILRRVKQTLNNRSR
jgi:hypothetical protein